LLTRLCILESAGIRPNKSLRRALAQLVDSLVCNNLSLAIKWCSVVGKVLADQAEKETLPLVGPICLAGIQFHGFVPGCSPATILISMRAAGWPSQTFYEHDIKSAFETADLHSLAKNGFLLGIPHTSSLAVGIMGSRLIVRSALLGGKVFEKPGFAAAAIKQFPRMTQPGIYNFNNNELIQGSPLSPILFILYLASTSLTSMQLVTRDCPFGKQIAHSESDAVKGKINYWVYGDNVYTSEATHPEWADCLWKEPNTLGTMGKTLGLDYYFFHGRLIVHHPHKPYQRGVQKRLDLG